jgi:hypothetical protein
MNSGVVRPDQVSIGVLVASLPRDVVDAAVEVFGVREKRSDGKLPAHVVVYLVMALCLFADDDYEEVAAKVTGSLSLFRCWNASWTVPTASAITQARKRLGSKVMREVFEHIAQVVATPETRGAFLGRWLLLAIDGFEVDLPDSKANAAEFGYAGSGANRSAFPKARVVAIAETGTHAFRVAEIGAWNIGEKTLANRLYARLRPDELLTADRNFYSFTAWDIASRTGAALLWRAPTQLRLPVLDILDDGTFTTVLINPDLRGPARAKILQMATDEEVLDPTQGHLARVVEYDVPDREGNGSGELIVLLTSILDPGQACGEALAGAYHQRWEEETANDQLKTHLRGPGRILRSRLPDLVYQEIWAWLAVHHATVALIARAAENADIDPDRISFTRVLRTIRRGAEGTAAFSP